MLSTLQSVRVFCPSPLFAYTDRRLSVIAPVDKPLPIARNFEIIQALQTQVEPELFARPGVYDGRKNMFTAYELPFESGGREVSRSSHCWFLHFINFRFPVYGPYGCSRVEGG